jgi:hypothetical protein
LRIIKTANKSQRDDKARGGDSATMQTRSLSTGPHAEERAGSPGRMPGLVGVGEKTTEDSSAAKARAAGRSLNK